MFQRLCLPARNQLRASAVNRLTAALRPFSNARREENRHLHRIYRSETNRKPTAARIADMSAQAPTVPPPVTIRAPVPNAVSLPSAGARANKVTVSDLSFFYGAKRALESISLAIQANVVTAFIGPSGCG